MASIFQSLAHHGGSGGGAPQKRHLVSFRAGKMHRDGNMVKPDTRKGLVYLDIEDDTLLHFCWKDRGTNNVEDNLIIFPEEAEWKKVDQANGRVYMLAFKSSSQKHFFWMQEPKDDQDAVLANKVNKAINDPSFLQQSVQSPSSGGMTADQEQLFRVLQQSMSTGQPIPAGSPSPQGLGAVAASAPSGASNDQMAQMRNLLAGIQVPQGEPDVDLTTILTPANVLPLLENPASRTALFPHLPEGAPHTPAEIEETLRSPQFKQSMQALAYALRSGQLRTILQSMGLDPNNAGNAQGVEGFLRAIQRQFGQGGGGNNADGGDDPMDLS